MLMSLNKRFIEQAHIPFCCRRVDFDDATALITGGYRPKSGDLVLAKVKTIRQHKRIELATGRKPELAAGDLVILAYGNRYAPDQFEGLMPDHLGECDMVAAGGVASIEVARNKKISSATKVSPLGVLADKQGKPLNLMRYRLKQSQEGADLPPVLVVCGTSMNAGKTHTAVSLIRGLNAAGLKVGATKVTGTGAGGDIWRMQDAGAGKVLDFTDAGYATTYLNTQTQLVETMSLLTHALAAENVDIIVMEIADGLSHDETRDLLRSDELKCLANGVLFAAGDAMSAAYGDQCLRQWGFPPIAISGIVTLSPLATRELGRLVDTRVMSAEQLASPEALAPALGRLVHIEQRAAETGYVTAQNITVAPALNHTVAFMQALPSGLARSA